ncbi:arylsulfatase [Aestuariibaculum suncheonense]|uniref:Arylsulfatase n=1 Tax=Aestuariibaculum suncheonense TaxID=1028745 RepID=A0A8J6Q9I2_9FLAO|nr:arylsulfatase [Aestuariibaculum suncheonense]MBD0836212.1 arylsulfatase [Aestuariibaculum suncheonense]
MHIKNSIYFLTILSLFSCKSDNQKQYTSKPNIIYILADDLGYGDIGAYGQDKIETPNIDLLAKNGMLFTQHYSGAPVCAPARSSLLTGTHMGHSYIRGNDEWQRGEPGDVWNYRKVAADSTLEGQRPLPRNTLTIAKLLKQAGYTNGMFGKWGLGAPHTESIPTTMGFDYFFGYNCQRQAHTYTPLHLYENEKRYYLANDTVAPNTKLDKGADPNNPSSYSKYTQPYYAPDVSFEKMIGFIDSLKKDEPFFIYWASPIPHMPLQAPKNRVDYYLKKFGDEAPYIGNKGYFPNCYPKATYAAMVSYLDENIGKLIARLKETGKYDNTLIIFTSDNGPTYNGGTDSPWFDSARPFKSDYGYGKGFVYEGGIRVPMIASWPGKIKPNTTTDHISAFWDVMPTFCDIAQIAPPETIDGISFLNTLIQNENQKEHEYLYWEFPEYNGQVAVRMGNWKMIWKDIKKGNTEIELYDLSKDITEEHNIGEDHPEIIQRLYSIIKQEHRTPEIDQFKIEPIEELVNNNLHHE